MKMASHILLAAALVNCLAASLLFALTKKGVAVKGLGSPRKTPMSS